MATIDITENGSGPVFFEGESNVHLFENVTLGSLATEYTLFDNSVGITRITIDGTVISGGYGVNLNYGDVGDAVTVSAHGKIQSRGIGIQLRRGTVENHGTIEASSGIFTWETLTLINTGTIKSLAGEVQIGVSVRSDRNNLDITNSGVIEGTRYGILGATSDDIVRNSGSIKSDGMAVSLGAGRDYYDGRAGTVSKLNATAFGVIALGEGNDTAYGGAGQEQLSGGAGEDLIEGGGGDDQIDGGTQTDTVIFSGNRSDYIVEANADGSFLIKDLRTGHDGNDTVRNVERFKFNNATIDADDLIPIGDTPDDPGTPGNPGDPGIPGNPAPAGQTLIGTRAKDTLIGGAGNDKIYGKYGKDWLAGGAGQDVFVFDTKLGTNKTDRKVNFDTISDFIVAEDKIWLDNKIFKKLGKKGSADAPAVLNKKFFKFGKAKDKNDFVTYKKGIVSYDADGSGTKYKPVEIIKIANKAPLSADCFFIV